MEVYAVQEGPRKLLLVTFDLGSFTGTRMRGVAIKTTGAGVHCGNEHEVGGEGDATIRPSDGNFFVLERLAEGLEDVARVLRKLVEEKDAEVSEGDFAGDDG